MHLTKSMHRALSALATSGITMLPFISPTHAERTKRLRRHRVSAWLRFGSLCVCSKQTRRRHWHTIINNTLDRNNKWKDAHRKWMPWPNRHSGFCIHLSRMQRRKKNEKNNNNRRNRKTIVCCCRLPFSSIAKCEIASSHNIMPLIIQTKKATKNKNNQHLLHRARCTRQTIRKIHTAGAMVLKCQCLKLEPITGDISHMLGAFFFLRPLTSRARGSHVRYERMMSTAGEHKKMSSNFYGLHSIIATMHTQTPRSAGIEKCIFVIIMNGYLRQMAISMII